MRRGRFRVFQGVTLRLCAVVWCFGYIIVDLGATAQGRSPLGLMFLFNTPLLVLGVTQSLGLARLFDRLERRPAALRWLAVGGAGLVAGLVQTAADMGWLRLVALTAMPSWRTWALSVEPDRFFVIALVYEWTIFLCLALIWALRSSDAARANELRAAASEAAANRAEAAALRLQLNPHFLFNTLNSMTSLVVAGRSVQAEEMIGRLADFLRSSLIESGDALVPLAHELRTASAYLHIEEARFGDRLVVRQEVDPRLLQVEVPNFILQPLIENAVKHGAMGGEPLRIVVRARLSDGTAEISIHNSMPAAGGPERRADSHGIGLANTRRRLAQHFGEDGWLDVGPTPEGYRAVIGLPARGARAAA